jgi:hypothetical protein
LAPPDKFKRVNRSLLPGGLNVITIEAVSGDLALRGAGEEGGELQVVEADDVPRSQFARLLWIWLLHESSAVPLTVALAPASPEASFIVEATGPDGFHLTLLLDEATCLPVAATWERPPNVGDAMAGRAPTAESGLHLQRIDLTDYDVFGGISLPTRMRWWLDGVPQSEWAVAQVEVNPDLTEDFFSVSP